MKEKLFHSLSLPDDFVRGNILVSMHGQERIWIENFKGISSYTSGEIRLTARGKNVSVSGCNLRIVSYTKEEIEIAGCIQKLEVL